MKIWATNGSYFLGRHTHSLPKSVITSETLMCMWQATQYWNVTVVHASCALKTKLLNSSNHTSFLLWLSLVEELSSSTSCTLLSLSLVIDVCDSTLCFWSDRLHYKSLNVTVNKQLIIFLLDNFSVYRGVQLVHSWHRVMLSTTGRW